MANTFLRKTSRGIGNVAVTVGDYTVGSNLGAVVLGLSVSNTTSNEVYANVSINNGTDDFYLVKYAPIPDGSTLIIVGADQKVILQPGDTIRVESSANNSLDSMMSIMETNTVGMTDDSGGSETVISNAWGATDGLWYNSGGDNRVLFFRSSTTEELNNALALLGTGDVFKATTKINEDIFPGTVVQEVTFTVVSVDPGTEFEPVWFIDVTSSVSINADAELDGVIGITIV